MLLSAVLSIHLNMTMFATSLRGGLKQSILFVVREMRSFCSVKSQGSLCEITPFQITEELAINIAQVLNLFSLSRLSEICFKPLKT